MGGYEEAPSSWKDRVRGRVYWMAGGVGERLGVTMKNGGLNPLCMVCDVEHRKVAQSKYGGMCRKHYEEMGGK